MDNEITIWVTGKGHIRFKCIHKYEGLCEPCAEKVLERITKLVNAGV